MQATTGSSKAAKFAGANPLGPSMVDPVAGTVRVNVICGDEQKERMIHLFCSI
jgi:hypothetical protein